MKKLKTLIKLHKNQVDQTLKEIAQFNSTRVMREEKLATLSKEMYSEAEKFHASEYGPVLENYLVNAREFKANIEQEIYDLERQISQAQILLHDQFSELKKYEIALKNRLQDLVETERIIEIKEIDELNIIKHSN
jgi:hypothetical protein